MRLNSLHLVNFRQHADTRLEFDLGLTGIIGPNGAGKSTVLEAIAWALYGQSAVRGTRDSIRNVRAGARAPVRVELDFDLSGHRYRVVRGLSNAELYLDGGSEPIATTITDVSDLLARRLGMTRSEFFHTYFTGQKELAVMAAMSPTERAQFLSRVLGYDRIRSAQGFARERKKIVGAEINGIKLGMQDPEQVELLVKEAAARLKDATKRKTATTKAKNTAEAALAVIAPQWEAAQKSREALQQLLADLRLAEHGAEALTKDAGRLTRELDAVAAARAELEAIASQLAPLNELQGEWSALDALSREEGRRKALADSIRTLADELATIRTRQAAAASFAGLLDGLSTQIATKSAALEEATTSLEAKRTEWVQDREAATIKRNGLLDQYKDVKKHRDDIADLGEDGVCPTCQRTLGDHFRSVSEGLEEQLETITVNGKYYATRLEQLAGMEGEFKAQDEKLKQKRQELQELERQLAKSQAAAQELVMLGRDLAAKEQRHEQQSNELRAIPEGFNARRHAELERELKRLGPLNEQATRLTARIDNESSLRTEHERVARQLGEARDRVAGLTKRYEETRFSEEDMQRQRQEYDEAVASVDRAKFDLQTATLDEGRAAEAVASAERARQELERARDLHARLEGERRLHEELDRAYTDLRTDLNFQLRPELSDLASGFLNVLTDGRYTELELDDQYNLVVLEDGIPKPVISGGEEDLSNLVLRLAISQMIADRSGQDFSLLVLDEVFGSLDVDRRQNVVELLRRLEDRFEQVILITHIEGVKDELDHVVMVDYDADSGSSRVRHVDASSSIDGFEEDEPVEPVDQLPAGAET